MVSIRPIHVIRTYGTGEGLKSLTPIIKKTNEF